MHNLRLTAIDALDFCRRRSNQSSDIEESVRLNMAISIYSDNLIGLVMMSDSRPLSHINYHSGLFCPHLNLLGCFFSRLNCIQILRAPVFKQFFLYVATLHMTAGKCIKQLPAM